MPINPVEQGDVTQDETVQSLDQLTKRFNSCYESILSRYRDGEEFDEGFYSQLNLSGLYRLFHAKLLRDSLFKHKATLSIDKEQAKVFFRKFFQREALTCLDDFCFCGNEPVLRPDSYPADFFSELPYPNLSPAINYAILYIREKFGDQIENLKAYIDWFVPASVVMRKVELTVQKEGNTTKFCPVLKTFSHSELLDEASNYSLAQLSEIFFRTNQNEVFFLPTLFNLTKSLEQNLQLISSIHVVINQDPALYKALSKIAVLRDLFSLCEELIPGKNFKGILKKTIEVCAVHGVSHTGREEFTLPFGMAVILLQLWLSAFEGLAEESRQELARLPIANTDQTFSDLLEQVRDYLSNQSDQCIEIFVSRVKYFLAQYEKHPCLTMALSSIELQQNHIADQIQKFLNEGGLKETGGVSLILMPDNHDLVYDFLNALCEARHVKLLSSYNVDQACIHFAVMIAQIVNLSESEGNRKHIYRFVLEGRATPLTPQLLDHTLPFLMQERLVDFIRGMSPAILSDMSFFFSMNAILRRNEVALRTLYLEFERSSLIFPEQDGFIQFLSGAQSDALIGFVYAYPIIKKRFPAMNILLVLQTLYQRALDNECVVELIHAIKILEKDWLPSIFHVLLHHRPLSLPTLLLFLSQIELTTPILESFASIVRSSPSPDEISFFWYLIQGESLKSVDMMKPLLCIPGLFDKIFQDDENAMDSLIEFLSHFNNQYENKALSYLLNAENSDSCKILHFVEFYRLFDVRALIEVAANFSDTERVFGNDIVRPLLSAIRLALDGDVDQFKRIESILTLESDVIEKFVSRYPDMLFPHSDPRAIHLLYVLSIQERMVEKKHFLQNETRRLLESQGLLRLAHYLLRASLNEFSFSTLTISNFDSLLKAFVRESNSEEVMVLLCAMKKILPEAEFNRLFSDNEVVLNYATGFGEHNCHTFISFLSDEKILNALVKTHGALRRWIALLDQKSFADSTLLNVILRDEQDRFTYFSSLDFIKPIKDLFVFRDNRVLDKFDRKIAALLLPLLEDFFQLDEQALVYQYQADKERIVKAYQLSLRLISYLPSEDTEFLKQKIALASSMMGLRGGDFLTTGYLLGLHYRIFCDLLLLAYMTPKQMKIKIEPACIEQEIKSFAEDPSALLYERYLVVFASIDLNYFMKAMRSATDLSHFLLYTKDNALQLQAIEHASQKGYLQNCNDLLAVRHYPGHALSPDVAVSYYDRIFSHPLCDWSGVLNSMNTLFTFLALGSPNSVLPLLNVYASSKATVTKQVEIRLFLDSYTSRLPADVAFLAFTATIFFPHLQNLREIMYDYLMSPLKLKLFLSDQTAEYRIPYAVFFPIYAASNADVSSQLAGMPDRELHQHPSLLTELTERFSQSKLKYLTQLMRFQTFSTLCEQVRPPFGIDVSPSLPAQSSPKRLAVEQGVHSTENHQASFSAEESEYEPLIRALAQELRENFLAVVKQLPERSLSPTPRLSQMGLFSRPSSRLSLNGAQEVQMSSASS